jgi:hypothetical protein
MDLRSWDFNKSPKISLGGEWKFYWNELLTFEETQERKEFNSIDFYSPWNEQIVKKFPAQGYATYALQVYLPKNAPELAIEVPSFYCSYQLIINDKIIAKNGSVGTDKNSTVPYWRSYFKKIEPRSDTLNIVLHVANFHHSRGGTSMPIHLGVSDSLQSNVSFSNLVTKVLSLILMTIAVFFLFYKKNRKTAIYFSAVCFSWLLRALFSNQYLFHDFFELSWVWAVRIEYFSFILTAVFGTLCMGSLYRQDTNILMKYFLVLVNVAFLFLILVSNPPTFTKYIWLYLAVAMLTVLFVFFIVFRALVYDRAGVWFSTAGLILLAALFGYNIIAYVGNFDVSTIVFYSGFIAAFVLNGWALHYRSTHPDHSDTLTMEDLYGKNSTH